MSLPALIALLGWLLLFFGERTFGTNDTVRMVLGGLGLLGILGALALRFMNRGRAPEAARSAWGRTLVFSGISLVGLLLYVVSLDPVVALLSLGDDAQKHLVGVLRALWPLVMLLGLVPMILVDRALQNSPTTPHPRRISDAWQAGVLAVLALSLLFPLNYLAKEYNKRWDVTFFRTTAAGSAVRNMVEAADEPIEAVLFFPSSNEVASEVLPYFEALEGPNFSVRLVDQALEPGLAKDMKIRENGQIALKKGDAIETIKLDTDFDKAKRNLKKLDSMVQSSMLKLAKGARVAYVTVGHGEIGWKGGEEDGARKGTLVKKLLEALNYKVKELGMGDGLASAVPDDATAVFVLGPTDNFLPEEVATLNRYREAGGRLFLALDPNPKEGVDFSALLDPLGIEFKSNLVVTDEAKTYLPVTGGKIDRQNLGTNKYSSHESVTTLSKNSKGAWLVFLGAGELVEKKEHGGKVTVTVRSLSKAWADLDGNFEFDKDTETRAVKNLAAVASGPAIDGKEYRAVVVSDSGLASDVVITNPANTQFVADATFWLAGEEDLAGATNNEEDVKIRHNKEGQGIWFYGSSFLLPLLLGLAGLFHVRSRRAKGVA